MLPKVILSIWLLSWFFLPSATAGQTISTREMQGFFYADGKMEKSDPQFEITYFIEGDKITRTRVYDFKNKKVIPDNTAYQILRHLSSDPSAPIHEADKALGGKDVLRAIGEPGMDAVETLVITKDAVASYKSTSDYMVISRSEIISIN